MKKFLTALLAVGVLSGCANLGDTYQSNLAEMESIVEKNNWYEQDLSKFPNYNTSKEFIENMKALGFDIKSYYSDVDIGSKRNIWTRIDMQRGEYLRARTLILMSYDCANESNDRIERYYETGERDSDQVWKNPVRDIIKTESYSLNKAGYVKQTQYFSEGKKRSRTIYIDPVLVKQNLSPEQLNMRRMMRAEICSR